MILHAVFVIALADVQFAWIPVSAEQEHGTTTYNAIERFRRGFEGNGCILPPPLKDGRYSPSAARCSQPNSSPDYCQLFEGSRVPGGTPLIYECDPGYTINATGVTERAVSVCVGGMWKPPLPHCVESHYDADNLPRFQLPQSHCGKPENTFLKPEYDVTVSKKGAWPWMAIFGIRKNNSEPEDIHWFCVGTLITSRHILTAAHCVADYRGRNMFFARFNDIDLDDPSDNEEIVDVQIQRSNIIIHPKFKKEQVFSHNLAIIKLNSNLPYTDFIRPICLPSPDFSGKTFDNEIVYFTTWGQTDNDREWTRKRRYRPILQQLRASIQNHATCKYNYRSYQSETFLIINWDLICASVPSNKSCQSDAGSPLMLRVKDKFVLLGVVATPFTCHDEIYPRLFTRLSEYMDWIIANIKF